MSSGTFCTGTPPAQSSSFHSRCSEELEGSGKCRVALEVMSDRGTGVRLAQEVDCCRGWERRRHSGWIPGS